MNLDEEMDCREVEEVKAKVRISKTLSEGEKSATASRKEEVKKGLAKLGLQCDVDQVPNIALLASGGALRAMMSLYGTLGELKKYNLLDCIMYLAAVSGSTWGVSDLYKIKDWAEKIEEVEKQWREKLVLSQWDFDMAKAAVVEAAKDELYSLTDFWSYFVVYKMLNQFDETELSAHRESCENGKNPYPIYAAVDKNSYNEQHAGTWFEFTPHEAGIPGLGAYIDIKHFGSIFGNGQLKEERKEKTICYLQGLWGSSLASEEEVLNNIKAAFPVHERPGDSDSEDLNDQNLHILSLAYLYVLELYQGSSSEKAAEDPFSHLESLLKNYSASTSYELLRGMRDRWASADAETRKEESIKLCEALDSDFGGFGSDVHQYFHSVVRKTFLCILNWTWGSTNNFLYNCPDIECPELTREPVISLIDAGLAINTAYPLILHPERQVKLILSFDYSAGDPFLTIKNAAKYCEAHRIPFPKIDENELQDGENLSDCYVFKGEGVPTVMHFPLFNKVNCLDKIDEYREEFSTFKMSYSHEDTEKLLTAAKKNVVNVQQKILEEIRRIVGPSSQNA